MPSTAEISEHTLSIVLVTAGQQGILISLSPPVKKEQELKEWPSSMEGGRQYCGVCSHVSCVAMH